MILDAVRESQGTAIAVQESRLSEWLQLAVSAEGISVCPEAAACIGALQQLTTDGWIQPEEHVVVFHTGAAQKYPEAIENVPPFLDTNGD